MSKLRTRLSTTAAAAVAVCGVATIVAAPAQAAGRMVYKVSNGNGAYGEFRSYGEVVCATDTKADGHGAMTIVAALQGGSYRVWFTVYEGAGAGHTLCKDGGDLAEGTKIMVSTCLQDGSPGRDPRSGFACSAWKYGTA
ncbi:hypothetical protein GCM10023205_52820 [Yinghuangia aomiensis]|uniref:Secreted protein n=2 Tax=Yinghuangia aomiensis TaxID=676205 RepID=A0ABP9HTJ6_9ACTN